MKRILIPLFKNISDSEWEAMSGCMHCQRFEKNSIIFHQGDVVHEVGIVLSGNVHIENIDILGNRSILSDVPAGHVFAETYAFCGEPLMVDAVASETSVILFLDMNKLLDTSLDNGQFKNTHFKDTILDNLLHISIQKNLTLSNRIFCTSPKTIRERLLIYLSNESRKAGSQEFVIPFDRQQLADYLNVDRSALSKELGRMRDEGLIEFRKNKFHLLSIY